MRLPITPATTLLRELRDEVRRENPRGRLALAVDGRDGVGKTRFSDAWADVFAEAGAAVYRASLDDFHRPRIERYARGRQSPDGFYLDSYDYSTFRRVLLDPFLGGGELGAGFQLAVFDVRRDAPRKAQWTTGPKDAVLIVDGIFALRPELRDAWTYTVWLDASPEVTFARMAERDGTDPDPHAATNARYAGGWELYARERPREAASAVVDNNDPVHPVRLTGWR